MLLLHLDGLGVCLVAGGGGANSSAADDGSYEDGQDDKEAMDGKR